MENKNNKKSKISIIVAVTIAIIAVTLGTAYAFFSYRRSSESSSLIAGDIYMHYKGQNTGINIDNAIPSETYDPKEYFEFTIEGKNTYTEKDIWYEIDLVYGDQPAGRDTRIRDSLLKFTLFEKVGNDGVDTKVLDGVSYDEINNKKIWVNKIDKNTTEETKITYKLYMWISNDTVIGDNGDYTTAEWNENVYASVKVNVKGDFNEKSLEPEKSQTGSLITTILGKAYTTDGKEIIALDVTDKNNVTKCASVEACRGKKIEYRYSGPEVNNYIYLKDNNNSNELWRIIGIFEDYEVGQYVKIVRDDLLPTEKMPEYYTASNQQKYKINTSTSMQEGFWNRLEPHDDSSLEKNNWPDAGLQYWLNDTETADGYLTKLSGDVKNKLVSVKHYLGTARASSPYDTPLQSYARERDVESCNGKGPVGNTSASAIASSIGCQVWAGNDATWTGKVSLMYPSDYGFSAINTNWSKPLYATSSTDGFEDTAINKTSWMFNTMTNASSKYSWLLSPVYNSSGSVAVWGTSSGGMYSSGVHGGSGVRPVLNLSSQISLVGDGDGTAESPYEIFE